MLKPDFGETQLQQWIGTEFAFWAREHHRMYVGAIIPTLPAEKGLGWDTGFYFPWLRYPPLPRHRGCNLFIQYKISSLIEGKRGKHYGEWNRSYFYFKIPHVKKRNRKYELDYHQYTALKRLKNKGCEAYYATNQVLSTDELRDFAAKEALIDNTPFLEIGDITKRHESVTFTESSRHFFLHSEVVKARRSDGKQLKENLMGKNRDLGEDNAQIFEAIHDSLAESEVGERYIKRYKELDRLAAEQRDDYVPRKFFFLQTVLLELFNITLIRFVDIN